jgi:hypothetical protein
MLSVACKSGLNEDLLQHLELRLQDVRPPYWNRSDYKLSTVVGTRGASMTYTRKILLYSVHAFPQLCSDDQKDLLHETFALITGIFGSKIDADALQQLAVQARQFTALARRFDLDLPNVHALSELVLRDLPTYRSVAPIRMQAIEHAHQQVKQQFLATNQRNVTLQVLKHMSLRYTFIYMMHGGRWGSNYEFCASALCRKFWAESGVADRLISDLSVSPSRCSA